MNDELSQGLRLHRAGKLDQAEAAYRQILRRRPRDADALHLLGVLAHQRRQHADAVRLIEQALAVRPDNAAYLSNHGAALAALGSLSAAEESLRRATALNPSDPEALCNLGIVLRKQGRHREAVSCYDRSLELREASAETHNNRGVALSQCGELAEAERAYRRALSLRPNYAEAWNNLGLVLRDEGRTDEALDAYSRALAIQPRYAEALNNRGTVLTRAGRLPEAMEAFRAALEIRRGHGETLNNLGMALNRLGRSFEALQVFEEAVLRAPHLNSVLANLVDLLRELGRLPEAAARLEEACRASVAGEPWLHLGGVYQHLGRLDEAARALGEAARRLPRDVATKVNLGVVLKELGRLDEAEKVLREALSLDPASSPAWNNLGTVLKEADRLDEALTAFDRALSLSADDPAVLNNRAGVLCQLGRAGEGLAAYDAALAREPGEPETLSNLGAALAAQGRWDEALVRFDQAISGSPEHAVAHFHRAAILLRRGEFEEGWAEYEWRWKCPGMPPRPFLQPLWDGSELTGRTILLHAEQGLGDTIQFARFVPEVKKLGGRIRLEVPSALIPLFRSLSGVDEVVKRGETVEPFDVHAPLMSLPRLLGKPADPCARGVPYLSAPVELEDYWRSELDRLGGLRVGIAWQGNPKYRADRWRSVPLSCLEPLARLPGVRLVSIQKGPGRDQLERQPWGRSVVDFGDRLDGDHGSFMDTAALLRVLDLVIVSDSAVAHLAGALGVEALVALPTPADWRWRDDGEGSAWYPSLRLFRQPEPGCWSKVMDRLARELERRMHDSGRSEKRVPSPPESSPRILVEVSAGELADKVTILQIKNERISDEAKLAHVRNELGVLSERWDKILTESPGVQETFERLREVNEALWEIEDRIREHEGRADFGPQFVELARSVYRRNDERARLKREINDQTGSRLVEVKSYGEYAAGNEGG
jgi:tetratricopeptide (TPR) repeat protein